jgi:hypothetical protein
MYELYYVALDASVFYCVEVKKLCTWQRELVVLLRIIQISW